MDDGDDSREQDEMNSDGKYEVFASINDAVMEELKQLVEESKSWPENSPSGGLFCGLNS